MVRDWAVLTSVGRSLLHCGARVESAVSVVYVLIFVTMNDTKPEFKTLVI